MSELFLRLETGESAGKIFKIDKIGAKLGRSSSSDIHILDAELSRSHCLFDFTDKGEITVMDLASANGTFVNDENIGSDSKVLKLGDKIAVGDSVLTVVDSSVGAAVDVTKVDLGLKAEAEGGAKPESSAPAAKRPMILNVLWASTIAILLGAAALILLMPREAPKKGLAPEPIMTQSAKLKELHYEKVEADASHIFRYELTLGEDGTLKFTLDDVPDANRHIRKTRKISETSMKLLERLFSSRPLAKLEKEYSGERPSMINRLRSYNLKVVFGKDTDEVSLENATEPEVFNEIREQIETFVNNELGLWSLQYSKETLVSLAEDAFKIAEAKWDERDIGFGRTIHEAIDAYKRVITHLETIEPKPEWYMEVLEHKRIAEEELDQRHKEYLFKADHAINIRNWNEASEALKLLRDLIPDKSDPRHQTAERKLQDVERRMKGERK